MYVTPLGIELSMLVRIETHQIGHGIKTTIQVRVKKPILQCIYYYTITVTLLTDKQWLQ